MYKVELRIGVTWVHLGSALVLVGVAQVGPEDRRIQRWRATLII
jgi:hypothetical protein